MDLFLGWVYFLFNVLSEIILTDEHMVPRLQGPVQTIDPDFEEKKSSL